MNRLQSPARATQAIEMFGNYLDMTRGSRRKVDIVTTPRWKCTAFVGARIVMYLCADRTTWAASQSSGTGSFNS